MNDIPSVNALAELCDRAGFEQPGNTEFFSNLLGSDKL